MCVHVYISIYRYASVYYYNIIVGLDNNIEYELIQYINTCIPITTIEVLHRI